jgi:hypothetical protein
MHNLALTFLLLTSTFSTLVHGISRSYLPASRYHPPVSRYHPPVLTTASKWTNEDWPANPSFEQNWKKLKSLREEYRELMERYEDCMGRIVEGVMEIGGLDEMNDSDAEKDFKDLVKRIKAERVTGGVWGIQEFTMFVEEGIEEVRMLKRKLGDVEGRIKGLAEEITGEGRMVFEYE